MVSGGERGDDGSRAGERPCLAAAPGRGTLGGMSEAVATVCRVDGGLDDAARAARVFAGDLVVHRGLPAMAALVAASTNSMRAHFGDDDPPTAQQRLDRPAFLAAAAAAQADFERSPEVKRLMGAVLVEAGVVPASTWWDKRALRVLPSGDTHSGGRISTTHVHRDTWGSNVYAQLNWWAPLFPLEAGRTIAFYPAWWRTPLANSSDRWSFEAYLAAQREVGRGLRSRYPSAPEPLAPVHEHDAQRVLVEAGELLCFSAAHLHGGLPNRTGRTRFSIETRTVSAQDLAAGRAAPNVDGHGRIARTRWFRGMLDDRPMASVVSVPPVSG